MATVQLTFQSFYQLHLRTSRLPRLLFNGTLQLLQDFLLKFRGQRYNSAPHGTAKTPPKLWRMCLRNLTTISLQRSNIMHTKHNNRAPKWKTGNRKQETGTESQRFGKDGAMTKNTKEADSTKITPHHPDHYSSTTNQERLKTFTTATQQGNKRKPLRREFPNGLPLQPPKDPGSHRCVTASRNKELILQDGT